MMHEIVEGIVVGLESIGGLFIHIDGGLFTLTCVLLIVIGFAWTFFTATHSGVYYDSVSSTRAGYGVTLVVATVLMGLLATLHPQSQITTEDLLAGGGILITGLNLVIECFAWRIDDAC